MACTLSKFARRPDLSTVSAIEPAAGGRYLPAVESVLADTDNRGEGAHVLAPH